MSDYGDANLPDPPAYDPRVERADAEEELIAYRSQRLLDIALDEDNLFVCGALVWLIASSKSGQWPRFNGKLKTAHLWRRI